MNMWGDRYYCPVCGQVVHAMPHWTETPTHDRPPADDEQLWRSGVCPGSGQPLEERAA